MRRLSGHAHAQPSVLPRPADRHYHDAPSGCLPASSYRRNPAATGGCTVIAQLGERAKFWPFLTITAPVAGSVISASACRCSPSPLLLKMAHAEWRSSGHVQHLVRVRATLFGIHLAQRRKIPERISPSVSAIPGASDLSSATATSDQS